MFDVVEKRGERLKIARQTHTVLPGRVLNPRKRFLPFGFFQGQISFDEKVQLVLRQIAAILFQFDRDVE